MIGISGAFGGPSKDMFTAWAGCQKQGEYLYQIDQARRQSEAAEKERQASK